MARVALVTGMIAFRLAVTEVLLKENREEVRMSVTHTNDPNDPNASYAKFTPAADFYFSVTNPDAFGYFQPGTIYNLAAVSDDSGLTLVAQDEQLVPASATPQALAPATVIDPAPVFDPPAVEAAPPVDAGSVIDPPAVVDRAATVFDPAPVASAAVVDPAPVVDPVIAIDPAPVVDPAPAAPAVDVTKA